MLQALALRLALLPAAERSTVFSWDDEDLSAPAWRTIEEFSGKGQVTSEEVLEIIFVFLHVRDDLSLYGESFFDMLISLMDDTAPVYRSAINKLILARKWRLAQAFLGSENIVEDCPALSFPLLLQAVRLHPEDNERAAALLPILEKRERLSFTRETLAALSINNPILLHLLTTTLFSQ